MRLTFKLLPFAFLATTLHAQNNLEHKPDLHPEQKWPTYRTSGDRIDVVTLAEPTVRHACKIKHFNADSVVCRGIHGAKPATYKRDDVLALIDPPVHAAFWQNFLAISLGAGLVAASPFVPVTGIAVLFQVTGGIALFGGVCDFFDGGWKSDHDDDVVLYQRPETTLAVALNPGR